MTREVVRWYGQVHRGSDVLGLPAMFFSSASVGAFAVAEEDFYQGEPAALFKMLIATTMFQRRQDRQILRILQGMEPARAEAISSLDALLEGVEASACPHLKTLEGLLGACDLGKDPATARGCCSAQPTLSCPLKAHTEWLKRYGHFGKVPTALALAIRERGAAELRALYTLAVTSTEDAAGAAAWIEEALSRGWRVSRKISAMFLSMVSNPALSARGEAPWAEGLDWRRFVVIDSNVDLYLRSIGYEGSMSSYDARHGFLCELAAAIPLGELMEGVEDYNPRLVQQALYLFMSATNRRALEADCAQGAPATCLRCPMELRDRCALRAGGGGG